MTPSPWAVVTEPIATIISALTNSHSTTTAAAGVGAGSAD